MIIFLFWIIFKIDFGFVFLGEICNMIVFLVVLFMCLFEMWSIFDIFFVVSFFGMGINFVFGMFGFFIGLMFWRINIEEGLMLRLGELIFFVRFCGLENIIVGLVWERRLWFLEVEVLIIVLLVEVRLFLERMMRELEGYKGLLKWWMMELSGEFRGSGWKGMEVNFLFRVWLVMVIVLRCSKGFSLWRRVSILLVL